MTVKTELELAFDRVVDLIKLNRDNDASKRGDLTTLNTTAKTSLVSAINDLQNQLNNLSQLDDTGTSSSTGWSSQKISAEINSAITGLINGAATDSDTLKELSDKIAALAQADAGLVSALSPQAFTDAQKEQARNNIGAASAAVVGDWTTETLVARINARYTA